MMSSSRLLISTAYFPPIQYFVLIGKYKDVLIEKQENYNKQSYRNRCNIKSANGVLPLVIPVKKNKGLKTVISDIKTDNSYNWQRIHRISIESAYRSAPFYEYYIDEIMPFFESRYDYLLDLNTAILEKMLEILRIRANLGFTDKYQPAPPPQILDIRNNIHPKIKYTNTKIFKDDLPYTQVFNEISGFIPGLSIIDLIFNTGPDAETIICESYTCINY